MVHYWIQEPFYRTVTNIACLILVGKIIQRLVFGELYKHEWQNIKSNFWNFMFGRLIFIFGVLYLHPKAEIISWCSWFSVYGFLHLLAYLSNDRIDSLSFSSTTSRWIYVRLLTFLLTILVTSLALLAICVIFNLNADTNTYAFIAVEYVLLSLRIIRIITRLRIHFWDSNHEDYRMYTYASEFAFELVTLSIDFVCHVFMLGNIIHVSLIKISALVACVLIFMHLRYLFKEIRQRIEKHIKYMSFMRYMEQNCPMTIPDQLDNPSNECAICLDNMKFARKLPCGHLFHTFCMGSWLEQDKSCPNCRMPLSDMEESYDSSSPNMMFSLMIYTIRYLNGWVSKMTFEPSQMPAVRDRNLLQMPQLDNVQRILDDRPFLAQLDREDDLFTEDDSLVID